VTVIVVSHWLACGIMFVSTLDSLGALDRDRCLLVREGDEYVENKWRYNLFCGCLCTKGQLYTSALYWYV